MWTETATALVWHGAQASDEWLDKKKGRVGSSTAFGLAFGNTYWKKITSSEERRRLIRQGVSIKNYASGSYWEDCQTPDHYRKRMMGELPPVEMNDAMRLGVADEPKIREWHLKKLCSWDPDATIEEVGLMIWKHDQLYAYSPDGLVTDHTEENPEGLAEYKRTKNMYKPLLPRGKRDNKDDPIPNPTNIWNSHYAQMQFGMGISGRTWCDYVVYCLEQSKTYIQRVRANPEYFEALRSQIDANLEPWRDQLYPIQN